MSTEHVDDASLSFPPRARPIGCSVSIPRSSSSSSSLLSTSSSSSSTS